jgi:hypothetical protein
MDETFLPLVGTAARELPDRELPDRELPDPGRALQDAH